MKSFSVKVEKGVVAVSCYAYGEKGIALIRACKKFGIRYTVKDNTLIVSTKNISKKAYKVILKIE